jgi:hypothetical protein
MPDFSPRSGAVRSLTSSTTADSVSVVRSTSEPDLSVEDLALGDKNLVKPSALRGPRPPWSCGPIYIGWNGG